MLGSAKTIAAAVAFAAPVVLGVAYTGAASIGDDAGGGSGQTEDQFILATDEDGEYTIDRGQTGDVVTIVITGPDGNVVEVGDVPGNVANAVTEYASPSWTPPDEFTVIDDGTPCYHADQLADPLADIDGTTGAITSNPRGLFALEAYPDGSVDAAYFEDKNAYSHEELEAYRAGGGSYSDLEGALPLNACDG